jgi:predicted nucleic acid-binding protein
MPILGNVQCQALTPNIFTDKDFSFTDCTSFSIMSSLKLKSAFAFDKHFEQFEGIGRLP